VAQRDEVVVLVDERDRELGVMEKLRAHREGVLHRAVSVIILDSAGRLVLQQRSAGKYHGAGLWSNTACGHPRPDESPRGTAQRRLREEMGLTCALRHAGTVVYRAKVGDLIEHEVDHVFVGETVDEPRADPAEVMAWRAIPLDELQRDIRDHPERYTPWLQVVLDAARRETSPGLPSLTE
jgi:isopentenyl-diphosphate delta-isomerase